MDKLEIAKARELRGLIIETLYEFIGETISIGTVRGLLRYKSYNSDRDIKRAVNYLAGTGKEYIRIKFDDGDYWVSLIELTPKGVDLLENGGESDAGVMING